MCGLLMAVPSAFAADVHVNGVRLERKDRRDREWPRVARARRGRAAALCDDGDPWKLLGARQRDRRHGGGPAQFNLAVLCASA
jgi:hypothetical protein